MNWFLSIVVGLLSAGMGCAGALFVADKYTRWHRVSNFEGGAGYLVAFWGLAGIVLGLILGVVMARWVAASAHPTFFRGVGVGLGAVIALQLAILGLCYFTADFAPTIRGNALQVAFEVTCPPGYKPQAPKENAWDSYGAIVKLPKWSEIPVLLDYAHQREEDGRVVIPFVIGLNTEHYEKAVRVRFAEGKELFFPLPLGSHPKEKNLNLWSAWLKRSETIGKQEPGMDDEFRLRFQVRLQPPPPPEPTHEELVAQHAAEEEARFAALNEETPILQWLNYTALNVAAEKREKALRAIANNPRLRDEFQHALDDMYGLETAGRLMQIVPDLKPLPESLVPVIKDESTRLIAWMQQAVETPVEKDPSYEVAGKTAYRFSSWMSAVRALRQTHQVDFSSELSQMLVLARQRPDSLALRQDVVRVASYYLHEWGGVAPLASDPLPR